MARSLWKHAFNPVSRLEQKNFVALRDKNVRMQSDFSFQQKADPLTKANLMQQNRQKIKQSFVTSKLSTPIQSKKTQKEFKHPNHVWCRSSTVLNVHIGKEYNVHNGKNWLLVKTVDDQCGHKLGEFASTKKKTIHKLHKKKSVSIKKF